MGCRRDGYEVFPVPATFLSVPRKHHDQIGGAMKYGSFAHGDANWLCGTAPVAPADGESGRVAELPPQPESASAASNKKGVRRFISKSPVK